MKGVEFYFKRMDKRQIVPPFTTNGQLVFGQDKAAGIGLIVAFMHDYYSVGVDDQVRMTENTIAMCELLYEQQQLSSTN